jgi:hypothetical protein
MLRGITLFAQLLTLGSSPILPLQQQASQNVPVGDRITVDTPGGTVLVRNFYKDYPQVFGSNVVLASTPKCNIEFVQTNGQFLVTLYAHSISQAISMRRASEAKLLQLLAIDKSDACKLNVTLAVPPSYNRSLAGQNYGLSFCPAATMLPGERRASPAVGPNESLITAWSVFWSKLRAAVRRRDRATLRTLMAENFEYSYGMPEPGDKRENAFTFWNRPDIHGWLALDGVLAQGTVPFHSRLIRTEARIAPPSATKPNNYAWRATFQRTSDGRWVWVSFVSGD